MCLHARMRAAYVCQMTYVVSVTWGVRGADLTARGDSSRDKLADLESGCSGMALQTGRTRANKKRPVKAGISWKIQTGEGGGAGAGKSLLMGSR